jgi:hypothetical protein
VDGRTGEIEKSQLRYHTQRQMYINTVERCTALAQCRIFVKTSCALVAVQVPSLVVLSSLTMTPPDLRRHRQVEGQPPSLNVSNCSRCSTPIHAREGQGVDTFCALHQACTEDGVGRAVGISSCSPCPCCLGRGCQRRSWTERRAGTSAHSAS